MLSIKSEKTESNLKGARVNREDMFIPPQNIEAEQSVIGAILVDGDSFKKAHWHVKVEDFYKDAHRKIFSAIETVVKNNDPIDLISVSEILKQKGETDSIGGDRYLSGLASQIPTAANIEFHAKIVAEKSSLRKLAKICREIVADVNNLELDELLARLKNGTVEIAKGRGGAIVEMKTITKEIFEFLERRVDNRHSISGISTGSAELDELTDGLQNGDVIIIAGRPGSGKSARAMQILQGNALKNIPGGFISLEMGKHQLGIRTISAISEVELRKLRKGFISNDAWHSLTSAAAKMVEMPLYFSFDARKTEDIEKVATQMIETKGVKIIAVDYLQLISSVEHKKREQEVAEISRLMKTIAQRHNIPVIAIAQLNRAVEHENRRPRLSDLRESGAIEQDADVIIFLHRDSKNKNIIEVIIGKGRNIDTGFCRQHFDGDRMTFHDLAQGGEEDAF